MKRFLAFVTCALLMGDGAAFAQTTNSPSTPSAVCQAGQVLQGNGQSCVQPQVSPAPVQSTGALGQFPNDLLPAPSTGTSSGANCQPGQALTASGQPCN